MKRVLTKYRTECAPRRAVVPIGRDLPVNILVLIRASPGWETNRTTGQEGKFLGAPDSAMSGLEIKGKNKNNCVFAFPLQR